MASSVATLACTDTDNTFANNQALARRPVILLNDIHIRACQKWRAAGQPRGDGSRFWLEAEQELLREKGPHTHLERGQSNSQYCSFSSSSFLLLLFLSVEPRPKRKGARVGRGERVLVIHFPAPLRQEYPYSRRCQLASAVRPPRRCDECGRRACRGLAGRCAWKVTW